MAGQLEQNRGREMDRDGKRRGEDLPTQRDGGRWRGGGVGRACLRVVVGGESCKYTREPMLSTELEVILH